MCKKAQTESWLVALTALPANCGKRPHVVCRRGAHRLKQNKTVHWSTCKNCCVAAQTNRWLITSSALTARLQDRLARVWNSWLWQVTATWLGTSCGAVPAADNQKMV